MNIENFPRQLIKDDFAEKIITKLLEKNLFELPLIELNPELRTRIFYAQATRNCCIGMENIEDFLKREFYGKQKQENLSERISRILLLSNDGSERFYRQIPFLQKNYTNILPIIINIDSTKMAEIVNLKDKKVKSVLIANKEYVSQTLKATLES